MLLLLLLLLLRGTLRGAERTHTYTHPHTHWSLCCIKRKKRSAEEGTEGHADWEY